MTNTLNQISLFGWGFITVIVSSPIFTSIVLFVINKRKNNAEIEGVISKSYHELLDSYKEERKYITEELTAVREQQQEYLKNCNILLASNLALQQDMKRIQRHHEECTIKNGELQKSLNSVVEKLKKHNIE